MRILYHHRTLADGAEGIHIHATVSALRKLGHQVDVLSLATPAGVGLGARGLLASWRQRLPAGPAEVARLAANLPEYLTVRAAIERLRPDAIYKRHAVFDAAACVAASHAGVPLVLEVNALYSVLDTLGLEPLRLTRVAASIERMVLRSARLVVAVSTPLTEQIRQLAGPDVPVCLVPNGADPEMFDPSKADGLQVRMRYGLTERFVVGWSGVLRSWHDLELLVRALQRVPEAALLIVGDGPERAALERHAGSLGVADRLHVTGRVPHSDVPQYVAAFDVAVAAGDRTGFASPMKVVEYMALARPVVVPRQSNFSDLVRHDATGLQFAPGDPADLADCVRALAASPELRHRLGCAARQEVRARLNWEANARAVLAELESVIASSGPSRT